MGVRRRTLFQAFLEDSPEGPQSLSGEFLESPGVFLVPSWDDPVRVSSGLPWMVLWGSSGGSLGGSLRPSRGSSREGVLRFPWGSSGPSQGVPWGSLGGALEGALGPSRGILRGRGGGGPWGARVFRVTSGRAPVRYSGGGEFGPHNRQHAIYCLPVVCAQSGRGGRRAFVGDIPFPCSVLARDWRPAVLR